MDYILFMFFICLGAYVVLYVLGRYYLLEPFESGETERARKMAALHAAPSTYNTTGIREDLVGDLPYATNPIMRLDDYEYSMIFQSEGNRDAQRRSISDAMSRYPSDWCALPPSAALFQTSQEGFTNAVARDQAAAPADVSEFDSISGTAEQPPDMDAIEEEEKKLLAMYKPEDTKDLIHYSLKDAKHLVKKMYEKRGLVADVQKYVPGYQLKNGPVFDGRRVSIFLEVAGLGDYLPTYAGNLDIMTASALRTGELIAAELRAGRYAV